MHIHLLQHGPAHCPARITDWLTSMGHSFTVFHLYDGELAPRPSDCDALIVLDGPETLLKEPPAWYKAEDKLIQRLVDSQKPLLGIGLGAHYIAIALGAISAPGTYPETGWHKITLADDSPFDLPEQFDAFMQGFAWDAGRVVGLLCHLEVTQSSTAGLMEHPPTPPGRSDYMQDDEEIFAAPKRFTHLAPLLDRVLTQWLRSTSAA